MALHPRNMSVAEKSDAVGVKLQRLLDGAQDARSRLIGKPIHQVEVQAAHSCMPQPGGNLGCLGGRLDPFDGFLNLWVIILHLQAGPAEP